MMSLASLQKEILAVAPTESTMTDGVCPLKLVIFNFLDHYYGYQV